MTAISAAQRLLVRVETYLAGVFHPSPEERVIAGTIQSFYGWFFALLRNAFICGALQYFAEKSGSMTLKTLVIIGYVVLAAYCLSYINLWVLTPFHFVKHKRLGTWLDGLLTLAVLLSLGYAIWKGTGFAIDEIAKGHAASRGNASLNSPGPASSPLRSDKVKIADDLGAATSIRAIEPSTVEPRRVA
jgi:hypothetical protein